MQPLPRSMEKPCNRRALALKRVRWEQGGGEGEMGISKRRGKIESSDFWRLPNAVFLQNSNAGALLSSANEVTSPSGTSMRAGGPGPRSAILSLHVAW